MAKISVVINTINEEDNIADAIDSVDGLADEIVVVDMESDDKTVEIAKRMGAKVFSHKRTGYVEPARNYAIKKATGDWILILDADERVPEKLSKLLKTYAEEEEKNYVAIPRKNIIFGKWIKHSRWFPDYNIRFFKKGMVTWSHIIHSVPETRGNGGDVEATEELALVHHHYTSISQYITRMDRYTSHQAKDLIKDDYKFKWTDLIRKPSEEFFSRYFMSDGYKDGLHGMALSLLQSFSELVKYLKVWEIYKFNEQNVTEVQMIKEMKEVQKNANYWYADTLLKVGGGSINRIKRKFKLS